MTKIIGAIVIAICLIFAAVKLLGLEREAGTLADAVKSEVMGRIPGAIDHAVGFDIKDYDKQPRATLERGKAELERQMAELRGMQREVNRRAMEAKADAERNEAELRTAKEQGKAMQAHRAAGAAYPVQIGGYTYASAEMLETALRNTAQKAETCKARRVYVENNAARFRMEKKNLEMATGAAGKALALLETKLTYVEGTETLESAKALLGDLERMYTQFDSVMTEEDVGRSLEPERTAKVEAQSEALLGYDFGD